MSQVKKSKRFAKPDLVLNRVKSAYHIDSDADLARFLRVNASTVATWRKTATMKFDRIFEFASALNMNWLLYGEGPVWRDESAAESPVRSSPAAEPEVPYYKSVSPGNGNEIRPEKGAGLTWIALPAAFITEELDANPEELFLMRASGDGMEPTIRDREFVLVRKSAPRPYGGRIYLVRIDRSLLLKRIHEKPDNRLLLMSDNRRYEHLELEASDNSIDIIGRVVWHGRAL